MFQCGATREHLARCRVVDAGREADPGLRALEFGLGLEVQLVVARRRGERLVVHGDGRRERVVDRLLHLSVEREQPGHQLGDLVLAGRAFQEHRGVLGRGVGPLPVARSS